MDSNFNLNFQHPLIPNPQDYVIDKKYVSIHSEDRDVIKFPKANDFEIELPQDYNNVYSARLTSWTFASNYDTFSIATYNITLIYRFIGLYNPSDHSFSNDLQNEIYKALYYHQNIYGTDEFFFNIESGFYTPIQMATELTNKMNATITSFLMKSLPTYVQQEFINQGGYNEFVVAYNQVGQNLYFGNKSSQFELVNASELLNGILYGVDAEYLKCVTNSSVPPFVNFGLPYNLGFERINVGSVVFPSNELPRFYYGDAIKPGDNGYWLMPNVNLPGSQVSVIIAPYKLNNMGPSHFYMEIDGLNCMDETSPYVLNKFTSTTNETNGVVNSAFAKIPITSTPLSQFYDKGSESYKYFNPPKDRIRRLRIKLRYHDNLPIVFGKFPFSFNIEFTMLTPINKKKYDTTRSYLT